MNRFIEALRWRGYTLKERGWGKTRAGRWLIDAMLYPNDVRLVRHRYREKLGRAPRLFFPRTFNEKIQRAKLFSRRRRHVLFADKLAVRDYVRDRIGVTVLTPVLWSGADLREARAAGIPGPFVIKATHGQGTNIFVKDPGALDWDAAIERVRVWKIRHYDAFAAEWQYRWIEPRLLIEQLVTAPDGGALADYKFFCFHGRARFVQVDMDRFSNHTRALFDTEWNRLPVSLHYPPYRGDIPKPGCLSQMIECAEILSRGESFLRVDLYDAGRPVFGELTLHPGAGLERFDPMTWDEEFGRHW